MGVIFMFYSSHGWFQNYISYFKRLAEIISKLKGVVLFAQSYVESYPETLRAITFEVFQLGLMSFKGFYFKV